jgi:hypothetical protein
MADQKISQLTGATTPLDGTEVLPIVQSGATRKVTNNDLRPKQIQSNATSGVVQVVGPAASSTRVMTVPNANFTAARTDAAQTFSGNQTFSGDVVFSGSKATNATRYQLNDASAYLQITPSTGATSVYGYVASALWSDFFNSGVIMSSGTELRPSADNVCSLGNASFRWTAVWATNALIQTSDERAKTEIQETPLGLSFIMSLKPSRYKMLESGNLTDGEIEEYTSEDGNVLQRIKEGSRQPIPGKRFHEGLIAQEVKQSLDSYGVDSAIWINSEDGSQGLRYEELISPLIKAMQELKSDFDAYKATHP